jgi:hypothetical protein
MQASQYPAALRERLGSHGTAALDEVLAVERTDLVTTVMDTFERRLAQECGLLRADLRREMTELRSDVRVELQELRGELRADFRVEVANVRSDLLKWSFLFWVGQVVAVVGLASAIG